MSFASGRLVWQPESDARTYNYLPGNLQLGSCGDVSAAATITANGCRGVG